MSDVVNKIKEEIDAFNAKRVELVEQLQTEFPKLLQPIFDQSKKIESIGWTQYTPYFNDGDSCEFSVKLDDLYINGEYDDDIEWYDWRVKYTQYHLELTKEGKVDWYECDLLSKFKEILRSIPEDFYEDLFGDHVMVTVYKDGRIEVEEYDHD